jgi:uncharacterized protein RhaS with RHS repeats
MLLGNGKRGKLVIAISTGSMINYFIGNHYEKTGSVVTKYYYSGGQRIAMRKNGALHYMFSDHLGSTSITTDANGTVVSEMRYREASLWDKAWGEVRSNIYHCRSM